MDGNLSLMKDYQSFIDDGSDTTALDDHPFAFLVPPDARQAKPEDNDKNTGYRSLFSTIEIHPVIWSISIIQ